ncbi:hypothetical protein C9374_009296 [Naegleria lovaniensis]|uniref:Peroxisomal biogenesis factor 11 n=1 Tax=Naegleria lovaniensis TaxID=51637 RepID=A0AA88GHT9_NAELO|nr:Peroxin 11b (Pex11b), putative [Naegleria lovaniensis]KAG2377385.1 hypothetical protein C9374_009296 [Naegleria lovaniensis]
MDHPIYIFLSQFVKIMDTLSGRDRVTKILQYGAKVVSYGIETRRQLVLKHLFSSSSDSTTSLIHHEAFDLEKTKTFYTQALKRTSNFESSISDARKVFRFFKSIGSLLDVYKFVINLYQLHWKKGTNNEKLGEKRPNLRWIDFVRVSQKFLLSIYILYDHASWAAKAGLFYDVTELNAVHVWQKLFNNSRAKHYSETSCKMWFIGTLLMLISDVYDFFDTFNEEIRCLREKADCMRDLPEGFLNLSDFLVEPSNAAAVPTPSNPIKNSRLSSIDAKLKEISDRKSQIVRNIIKNTSDLLVAGNGGYKVWSLNNAVVGISGCVSAVVGLYETWPAPPSK